MTDINAEVGQGQVLSEDQRVPSEDEYVLVRTKSRPTNKSTQLHVHPKSSRRMLRHPSWVQNNLYQSSRVFLDFRFMTCLSDSPLLWSELCLDLDFDMFWVLFRPKDFSLMPENIRSSCSCVTLKSFIPLNLANRTKPWRVRGYTNTIPSWMW